MALPDSIKLKSSTSRTTGIASQSVAAGANFLGSEIDNSTNLDALADIDLLANFSVAPTAGGTIEVYILSAIDGTNYEDGGVSTDPERPPDGLIVLRNATGNQRVALVGRRLPPSKIKLLVKSEADQTATVTVLCYTRPHAEIVD